MTSKESMLFGYQEMARVADELKSENDDLRSKLESAERDGKAAIASLNEVSKFSADGMKALTEKLEAEQRRNAAMREALVTVYDFFRFQAYAHEAESTGRRLFNEKADIITELLEGLATAPPSEWVRKSELDDVLNELCYGNTEKAFAKLKALRGEK